MFLWNMKYTQSYHSYLNCICKTEAFINKRRRTYGPVTEICWSVEKSSSPLVIVHRRLSEVGHRIANIVSGQFFVLAKLTTAPKTPSQNLDFSSFAQWD